MTTPKSDDRLIEKLILGQLPVAEAERLAVEYADDSRVAEIAESVSDTLVDSLRNHETADDSNANANAQALVDRVLDRLIRSGESSDPFGETAGVEPEGNVSKDSIPEQLEYFRIIKVLGQGGMGTVYLADDTRLGRKVALKTLKRELAANSAAKDRFFREAQSAARLEHDHIIPIYYVGEAQGTPFLAMPFLQGEPLDARLKRQGADDQDPAKRLARAAGEHKPLPISESIRIARQTALGLAVAHAQGLIHRDIKPANVWLEAPTGRVKILDFGLARSQTETAQLTVTGAIMGTPAYMAPEQARGKAVDSRADLFSLGCMLYEMLTGRRPFTGADTMAILSSLALDEPAAPHTLNAQCPVALSQLTMQLLAKQPEQRPARADEVAERLAKLEIPTVQMLERTDVMPASDPWSHIDDPDGTPAKAVPVVDRPQKSQRAAQGKSRTRWLVAAGLLLALLGGSAAYQLVFKTKDGTLIVDVKGDADVRFKNGELHIYGEDGKLKYALKPGEHSKKVAPGTYKVAVLGADGVKLETDKFEMTRGGEARLVVTAGPVEVAKVDGKGPPVLAKGDPAAPNYALLFNGQGDFVKAHTVKLEMSKPWTVESWVKCPDPKLGVGEAMPLMGNDHYMLAIQNFPDKGPRWYAASNLSPDRNAFQAPAVFDRWVHVATVYDGKEIILFVDGVPQTVPIRVTIPMKVVEVGLGTTQYYATEAGSGFRGLVDEIRVSSVARYTSKFTPQRRFEPDDQTVGLAHCDEGDGDVLKDSSANSHHGTIVGAKWVKVASESDRQIAEYVLSIGGNVRLTANGKEHNPKLVSELPQDPFELRIVDLVQNGKVNDAGLAIFKDCKELTHLFIHATSIGDAGLAHLKSCSNLTTLTVQKTKVTVQGIDDFKKSLPNCKIEWDDGVIEPKSPDRKIAQYVLSIGGNVRLTANGKEHNPKLVSELPQGPFELRIVDLVQNGKVNDAGLAVFKDCKELTHLFIHATPIGDAGLAHLKSCSNLTTLTVQKTKVTVQGIDDFKKALPNCKIEWDGGKIEPKVKPERYKNSDGMEFALVSEGKSWLGGGHGVPGSKEVVMPNGFYIGVHTITQEQWQAVMGNDHAFFFARNGAKADAVKDIHDTDLKLFPAERMSYALVEEFLAKLNRRDPKEGWVYRLPTGEEWEYACRGGPMTDKSESAFHFYQDKPSNSLPPDQANYGHAGGKNRTVKVGQYRPNKLGLYDMHANVMEWCSDTKVSPMGEPMRMVRGGSWNDPAGTASSEKWFLPSVQYGSIGVRVVRVPVNEPKPVDSFPILLDGGEWRMDGAELVQTKPGIAALMFGDPAWTDYDFTVETKTLSGPKNAQGAILFFRATARNNYMNFNLGSYGGGHDEVAHVRDGKWGREPRPIRIAHETDRWYRMKVKVRGDRGECFLDDKKVFDFSTADFPKGRVGLGTWNTAIRWRNLTVTGPDGLALYKGFPTVPQASSDADRKAAEYVLSKGAIVQVNDVDRFLSKSTELPREPFRLTNVFAEWKPDIDDTGLAVFQDCKHLKNLALWGTRASDQGLSYFKNCTELMVLSLNGDAFTDKGLEHFKDQSLLHGLHVRSKQVTDAGLAYFSKCKDLITVDLAHTQLTDEGVAYLKHNKKLKSVVLGATKVTDAGMAHLAGCNELEVLELFWNKIGDAGLVHFKDCKKLKTVNLHSLALVTDAGVANFKDCPNLTTLNLGGTQIGDAGIAALASNPNLDFLQLDTTPVTDAGLEHLKKFGRLNILMLAGTRVTKEGLVHLKECKNLTRLHLNETRIGDESVEVLKECWKLEWLSLGKTRITQAGFAKLREALPRSRIEHDGGIIEPKAK